MRWRRRVSTFCVCPSEFGVRGCVSSQSRSVVKQEKEKGPKFQSVIVTSSPGTDEGGGFAVHQGLVGV